MSLFQWQKSWNFDYCLRSYGQEEHDQIRAKKRDSSEALEWSDYKSMPFTQCVSISVRYSDKAIVIWRVGTCTSTQIFYNLDFCL